MSLLARGDCFIWVRKVRRGVCRECRAKASDEGVELFMIYFRNRVARGDSSFTLCLCKRHLVSLVELVGRDVLNSD